MRRLGLALALFLATASATVAAAAASSDVVTATTVVNPALRGTIGRRLPHPVVMARGTNEVRALRRFGSTG